MGHEQWYAGELGKFTRNKSPKYFGAAFIMPHHSQGLKTQEYISVHSINRICFAQRLLQTKD